MDQYYLATTEMFFVNESQNNNYTCDSAEESFSLRQVSNSPTFYEQLFQRKVL